MRKHTKVFYIKRLDIAPLPIKILELEIQQTRDGVAVLKGFVGAIPIVELHSCEKDAIKAYIESLGVEYASYARELSKMIKG